MSSNPGVLNNFEVKAVLCHFKGKIHHCIKHNHLKIRLLDLTIIGESRTLLRREAITLASHSKKFCPRQLRKAKRLKIYDPVSAMKNAPNICRLQIGLSMCSFHETYPLVMKIFSVIIQRQISEFIKQCD